MTKICQWNIRLKSYGELFERFSSSKGFLPPKRKHKKKILMPLCLAWCLELLHPFSYWPKDKANTENWAKRIVKKQIQSSSYFRTFIMRVNKSPYCLYQFELQFVVGCSPRNSIWYTFILLFLPDSASKNIFASK